MVYLRVCSKASTVRIDITRVRICPSTSSNTAKKAILSHMTHKGQTYKTIPVLLSSISAYSRSIILFRIRSGSPSISIILFRIRSGASSISILLFRIGRLGIGILFLTAPTEPAGARRTSSRIAFTAGTKPASTTAAAS